MKRLNRKQQLLGLLAGACGLACLGLAHSGMAARTDVHSKWALPAIHLESIPTDRYLDLGARGPRAASDTAYTPVGAPWSRPEVRSAPPLPQSSERRYVDLGRQRP